MVRHPELSVHLRKTNLPLIPYPPSAAIWFSASLQLKRWLSKFVASNSSPFHSLLDPLQLGFHPQQSNGSFHKVTVVGLWMQWSNLSSHPIWSIYKHLSELTILSSLKFCSPLTFRVPDFPPSPGPLLHHYSSWSLWLNLPHLSNL